MSERHSVHTDWVLAEHPGTCPLCADYIAKGKSWIVALAVPMPPSTKLVSYEARETPGWYRHTSYERGRGVVRARRWVHGRCAAKLGSLSHAQLQEMAQRRCGELQQHKDTEIKKARRGQGAEDQ
jgi:hypothetical protein